MSEIKLPVTVEEDADLFRENARSMWILREDDGSEIIRSAQQNALQRIAAALNAAPKHAFAELTAEVYGVLVDDALQEVQADPSAFVAGDAEYAALVNAAVLKRLQAFAAPVAPAWQPIETAPKGKTVLVFYRNGLGKGRTVKATFIERFTQESDGEEHGNEEYDEARDRYTWPEGWYEQIDNWEYAAAMFASDHKPTHWQPLPAAPQERPAVVMVNPQDGASYAAVSVPGWVAPEAQGGADHE